jgi:hypothetical protein
MFAADGRAVRRDLAASSAGVRPRRAVRGIGAHIAVLRSCRRTSQGGPPRIRAGNDHPPSPAPPSPAPPSPAPPSPAPPSRCPCRPVPRNRRSQRPGRAVLRLPRGVPRNRGIRRVAPTARAVRRNPAAGAPRARSLAVTALAVPRQAVPRNRGDRHLGDGRRCLRGPAFPRKPPARQRRRAATASCSAESLAAGITIPPTCRVATSCAPARVLAAGSKLRTADATWSSGASTSSSSGVGLRCAQTSSPATTTPDSALPPHSTGGHRV